MAHTFDIRFARSAGLAGMFEAPANSFRWKGNGSLRIDREGISIAAKRGLHSLFPRTRRVTAANLREVYREGEALRLEFTTEESARAVVSCWAEDADTAAAIVELLPTRRTVELEHETPRRSAARARFEWRAIALPIALAVGIAVGMLLYLRQRVVPNDDSRATHAAPLIPVAVELSPPRILVLPEEFITPIPSASPNFAVGRRALDDFEKEAATLLSDYRVDHQLLESGAMDWQTFANRLGELDLRWWTVTYHILENGDLSSYELLDLRATLLGAARHWRAFLEDYAKGLNGGDHVLIAHSFDELARAEELQSRARLYLR